LKSKNPKRLKDISIHSNIYMENTTTTETINEEATSKQKKLAELRKYNRDYYHDHKKNVGVRTLQEDLLERQRFEATPRKNPQVQTATSNEDHREVQRESG
ncbi:MAG: hypothetical protein ACKPKO_37620, partial [Candidatus Fonsibacter sp.]